MIKFYPDLKIFFPTKINDDTYYSGFGTRKLGNARNIEAVTNFFNSQNVIFDKLILLSQIHSTNIFLYDRSPVLDTIEKVEDTDGLVTKNSKAILIVRNADCVPLIFTDKLKGIIAISHQGWRGSLKRMAKKMVEKMLEIGAKSSEIIVAIGPAIGECHYDIDDDRYYDFREEFAEYSEKIFHKRKGRWHLDLLQLNYLQLLEAGVEKENIDFFPFCTECDYRRFFSRRRSGRQNFEEMFNFIVKLQ